MARATQFVCFRNGCTAFEQGLLSGNLKAREFDPPLSVTVEAVLYPAWI